jgi:REP element-mobilizing transposase RayT
VPVYLFSYHGYRTWGPDHRRGHTRRGEGYQPRDPDMQRRYDERATDDPTIFTREIQRALIEEAMVAARYQQFRLHAGAGEPTHTHYLLSWQDSRHWMRLRASLKTSLSLRLKQLSKSLPLNERGDRPVLRLSGGASRKRIDNQAHFDYHVNKYLPDHDGVFWCEMSGWRE